MLFFILLIYLITHMLLVPQGFWTVDNSVKKLQVEAIIRSDYKTDSLQPPGQVFDSSLTMSPVPPPFSYVKGRRLFSVFPPLFAWLSSIPMQLAGERGLYFIPMISAVMILAAMLYMTPGTFSAFEKSRSYFILGNPVFLAALCTPVWFYSQVFWEHTLTAALALWAVAFWLRYLELGGGRYACAAAVISALSIYLRDDQYIVFPALLVLSLFPPRPGRTKTALSIIVFLLCLIPLWFFQFCSTGSIMGAHLHGHLVRTVNLLQFLKDRPYIFYRQTITSAPGVAESLMLSLPFVLALLIPRRVLTKHAPALIITLPLIGAGCTLAYLTGLYRAESPMYYLLTSSNSFFVTAPVVILAVLHPDELCLKRILWFIILYAVLFCLCAPRTGVSGIHWGNRFLLPLYPLLVLLASRSIHSLHMKSPITTAAISLLIFVSLMAQLSALDILRRKKDFSHHLNEQVAALNACAIITDVWWVPASLHSLFHSIPMFLVDSFEQVPLLLRTLEEAGEKDILIITSCMDDTPSEQVIPDDRLHAFSLRCAFYNPTRSHRQETTP
jgi:hypothetical protein